MKKRNLIYILSVILTSVMIFYSCEKEDTNVPQLSDNEISLAEDDALAEALYDDIWDAVDNAVRVVDDHLYGAALKSAVVVSDSCPSITVYHPDTTQWPKVITIDYGDLNCEGFYGQTRRGKIVITITGRYMVPGSVKIVTLVDYYINEIHVEGTKTIINNGMNENENLTFSVELEGGKVTTPNGLVMERAFSRTREWSAGDETKNRWDDVYFITGSSTGVNFRGDEYTRAIISPLEWAASCRFIKSGTIEIFHGEEDAFLLDFGNGECDNEATIKRNGETKTILLKFRHRN